MISSYCKYYDLSSDWNNLHMLNSVWKLFFLIWCCWCLLFFTLWIFKISVVTSQVIFISSSTSQQLEFIRISSSGDLAATMITILLRLLATGRAETMANGTNALFQSTQACNHHHHHWWSWCQCHWWLFTEPQNRVTGSDAFWPAEPLQTWQPERDSEDNSCIQVGLGS